MTDIKEIATEQLRQCTWWGGAGQALPEFYVEQLITEIDRLNQVVDQKRHRMIGTGRLSTACHHGRHDVETKVLRISYGVRRE